MDASPRDTGLADIFSCI